MENNMTLADKISAAFLIILILAGFAMMWRYGQATMRASLDTSYAERAIAEGYPNPYSEEAYNLFHDAK
ncbi:MAG: hypothetical protein A3F99_02445 [Candidatus Colwellbacteria bacterium RIFCSPLOWO2_12_FULL_43_11]|uniref:Uncharacterized protein n=1 Tax=Candidatus Colwellbacteria bacterium RIFCSPLOWO2_12_FULL_43_11 TaxID=1797693 RepID=A0A1G1ZB45_9BACT|nr:MAG: hypothetical protein A3F99_02445 [Candidatus Colwellbacteria bacterium RIFCSPLOWO2_12_FULL_43_11]